MRNTWWLRVVFVLVLFQALTITRALGWPDAISENLPWPASPLNARFVAALYAMGAVSALLAVFARRYLAVRIPLVSVGVITGGLFLLTLPHLGEFSAADFPYRWLIAYLLDALVVAGVLWRLRGRDARPAGHNPQAPMLLGYAGVLAVVGAVLLLAPSAGVAAWPWSLSTILAQVYSVFFLTIAVGGVLAARDPRREASRIYLTANLVMVLLILAISVGYADRFVAGPRTWIWYALFSAAAVALALALVRPRGRAPRRAAAVS